MGKLRSLVVLVHTWPRLRATAIDVAIDGFSATIKTMGAAMAPLRCQQTGYPEWREQERCARQREGMRE